MYTADSMLVINVITISLFAVFYYSLFIQNSQLVYTSKSNQNVSSEMNVKNQELSLEIENITNELLNIREELGDIRDENEEKKEIAEEIVEVPANLYDGSAPLYTFLFEDMHIEATEVVPVTEKTVYLTFDDGPTYITPQILDILDAYNVKATFFVVGKCLDDETGISILQRIHESGHVIGAHSDTHVYSEIYSSPSMFLKDLYAVWEKIYLITGEKSGIYRFPGGSNTGHSSKIIEEVKLELERRGFTYFDWNVSADDSVVTGETVAQIYQNSINVRGNTQVVLLMHDSGGKENTVKALPQVIEFYQNLGYKFEVITGETPATQFGKY
ncbi:MAG: polysaccharide deacetylase family protein [Clostridia bacterium]